MDLNQKDNKYGLHTPVLSHRRPATCKEVECESWREGWRILADTRTELGQDQRDYFVSGKSQRHFTQLTLEDGKILFTFAPGQPCFKRGEHTISLEKAPDYRINGGLVGHTEFVDTYNENAYQNNQQRKTG